MKLYIDTSSNQKTLVMLGDMELIKDASVWRSQVVLPMIESLLKTQKKSLKDITAIEINPGPGSFTGLRVGAAIANALGFALGLDSEHKIVYS